MKTMKVALPEGTELPSFQPVAYYDKHMDCIRVLTHDRSVTEHRLDGVLTVYECNHRTEFDPQYVGFAIKGVRHVFNEVGLDLDGIYKLADIITKIIRHRPGSVVAEMLKMIYNEHKSAGELEIDLNAA